MNFHYEETRQGMTVNPEVDDATGELQGFNVQDSKAFGDEVIDQDNLSIDEYEDATGAPSPENPEVSPEELVSIHDEIQDHEYEYSEETANLIAQANIGDSPADLTVKHLSAQYFLGNLTAEEAFSAAIETGLAESDLIYAFNKLKIATNS